MKYSLFCDADKPGEVRKETDMSLISFIKLENILISFLHDSSAAGEMIYEMRKMISYGEFLGRRALLRDLENEKTYLYFKKLYYKICEYDMYREKYLFFKGSKYEALYFVKSLCLCLELMKSFAEENAVFKSELMTKLISVCRTSLDKEYIKELQYEIKEISEHFGEKHEASFFISKRNEPYETGILSINETHHDILSDFSTILDLPEHVPSSFAKLTEASFEKLFLKNDSFFIKIQSLFQKYGDSDILDFTIDKTGFKFFINIKIVFNELHEKGLPYCIPDVGSEKRISLNGFYDISLLLENENSRIVINNFDYEDNKITVISGANGGGKTCFLRGVCLSLFLFSIGLYIPASKGSIYFQPKLFVLYGTEESSENGIFMQEKYTIDNILAQIDENSVVFLNDIMTSTGEMKAKKVLMDITHKITDNEAFLFCVTHNYAYVDSVKTGIRKVLFLQPLIEKDSHRRTYIIRRVSAEYDSYSCDILKKYGLSKLELEELS